MRKLSFLAGFLVVASAIIIVIGCSIYNYNIGPVSKSTEMKEITIETGSTYLSIADLLKDNNLIKSKNFYKVYIKLFKPSNLEAGVYKLNENMGVKGIIDILEKGSTTNTDVVMITIPEGRHLEQIAEIVASKTNNSKQKLLQVWNSQNFINEAIDKYDFLTSEIKKQGIRYPLEGYLFPSTYELLNKNVTPEYIAYRMLDQMQVIYNKYKDDIKKSKYTFHKLITLASIVEYEAILDSERPIVAGVFYNRLNDNMKLQSCATIGYALNEWKLVYSTSDTEVDSPYNTYFYSGLPIGPGNMPGEKSIKAVIYPSKTDYYYFMANVCDPSNKRNLFSKTFAEHQAKVNQYLCS